MASITEDLEVGMRSYMSALSFMRTHGLFKWLLLPLILMIVLLVGGLSLISFVSEPIDNYLQGFLHFEAVDNWLVNTIKWIVSAMVWIISKLLSILVFAIIGGNIVLMLMSPGLAILSQITEEKLLGKDYPFSVAQILKDSVRGVVIALRNMFYQMSYMIALLIIGLIPVVGIVAVVVMFLVSAYYYGFSFIDYTSERRMLSMSESIKYCSDHKGVVVTIGAIFSFMLMIPWIGVSLAGFAAIPATVAATIAIVEMEQKEKQAIDG